MSMASRPHSAQLTRYSTPIPRYSTPIPPSPRNASSLLVHSGSPLHSRTNSFKLNKGANAAAQKCSVCANGLDYQWVLPGLHNFCTRCLEDYVLRHSRGKHCHCPICRAGIKLPKTPKQNRRIARYPFSNELVICDVCEDGPAFYKCSECNESFCEKCNKIHVRMKIGREHHVTLLSSIQAVNSNLKVKSYCDLHAHEEIRFHCKKCDVPICRDCKVLGHEGHLTMGLDDVYEERKQRVSHAMTGARGHLSKLRAECAEVKGKRADLEGETADTISGIRAHANKIKDVIDDYAETLIDKIRQQQEESRFKLEKCLDDLNRKIESLKGMIDTTSIQLDNSTDVEFVSTSGGLETTLRSADVPSFADKLWRKRASFERGEIDDLALQKQVGELKCLAEGLFMQNPAVELQIYSNFNCDQNFKYTSSIVPLGDGSAWVCNGYKNKLQRFDTAGRLLQSETLEYDVDDMTVLPGGAVLVTEYNGRTIRRLASSHVDQYFARSDLYLRGITTSWDGQQVIVCGNDVPVSRLKSNRVTKLIIYSLLGKKLTEIKISKGFNLFRVCHTVNGDFVVSTGVSGKYLVISADGTVRYTYTASGSADGVASDAHGLSVLSDFRDDTLHLLDSTGKPMPFTYSLNRPNAVAIDKTGYIWVGDWSKIRIMKYM